MSSESYAAWAKFDVEKELERVDQLEQREAQHKQQRKQTQAKESIESSATQEAQQTADILAAQAAVAALKAKQPSSKGRGGKPNNAVAAVAANEAKKAAKLQTQAALFAQKHELLQRIMENRRLGDKALAAGKKEAKQLFMTALAAVKKLEQLASELLKVEEEKTKLLEKESAETPIQHKESHSPKLHEKCKHEGEHSHSCSKNCSHMGNKTTKKLDEPLPEANDLMAILKMFYKDVYLGIGTCELEDGSLAAASEALKEVLIRDDVHLTAWLMRGEAFERMNAPLLAMLHYNRITSLDPEHEKGKDSLERVRTKLLTEGDAFNDSDTIKIAVSACTECRTFKEILERIQWTFEEANVLAIESFFDYSATKYQVVLGCLEALRERPEFSALSEVTVSRALREIEISCHVNIASGCLEMQRNYIKGLSHCEQSLRLDSSRVMTHFRMGQLYNALHDYEKALECFETAKALVPAATASQADAQRKQMLTTIVKEADKCEFDRNQYDTGYLRALAAK